jgi:hypothetical protein
MGGRNDGIPGALGDVVNLRLHRLALGVYWSRNILSFGGTVYIDDFIWLPHVIEKLESKHRVLPEEVEEVFFNHPHLRFMEKGHVAGEDIMLRWGRRIADVT